MCVGDVAGRCWEHMDHRLSPSSPFRPRFPSRPTCLIRVPPPNIAAHETVTVGHETVTSQLSGAETASAMIRAMTGWFAAIRLGVCVLGWTWVDRSTYIQVDHMMFDVHLQAVPIPITFPSLSLVFPRSKVI